MTDVRAEIGYSERTEQRPYFYANAHEKDFVPLKPVEVLIADARGLGCTLDREGFALVEHSSAVADLTDLKAVAEVHRGEIAELLKRKLREDEYAWAKVDIIHKEAERMKEIVRKIGRITRFETKAYVGEARILDLERASDEDTAPASKG